MTIRNAIDESAQSIARRDAETLLAHILGRDRAWLLAHSSDPLSAEHLTELRALTARRAAYEPLQHLTEEQEFFGLTLRVSKDTLIPRPETERLVEAVLDHIANTSAPTSALRILDIGTGTGAIAIALATHLPTAQLTAVDLSAKVLAIARENAARHHVAERIRFVESDLLASVKGRFDIIVSNPPYVSLADAPTLAPEVRDHEPHLALFGRSEQNPDGLGIYRLLIPQAHATLVPGGLLALEIGFGQSDAVRALFHETLWHNLRILDDYAAIPRVVLAERH
jgi:release factor glutamine methyltransferase